MTRVLQVGVKVLLKNPEGKFLLMRRSGDSTNGPGKWDIAGGRMEADMTMMENLAREVKEETGLVMTSAPKFLGVHDLMWPDRHVVRLTYSGTIDGEPTLSPEHSEYRWFTLDEIVLLEDSEFDEKLRLLFAEQSGLLM